MSTIFQEKLLTNCVVQLMKEIHEGVEKTNGSSLPECIMMWVDKYQSVAEHLRTSSVKLDQFSKGACQLTTDYTCGGCGCSFGPNNRFLNKMVMAHEFMPKKLKWSLILDFTLQARILVYHLQHVLRLIRQGRLSLPIDSEEKCNDLFEKIQHHYYVQTSIFEASEVLSKVCTCQDVLN